MPDRATIAENVTLVVEKCTFSRSFVAAPGVNPLPVLVSSTIALIYSVASLQRTQILLDQNRFVDLVGGARSTDTKAAMAGALAVMFQDVTGSIDAVARNVSLRVTNSDFVRTSLGSGLNQQTEAE